MGKGVGWVGMGGKAIKESRKAAGRRKKNNKFILLHSESVSLSLSLSSSVSTDITVRVFFLLLIPAAGGRSARPG